ncbi:hypothetical protein, partial [Escherichia coli]
AKRCVIWATWKRHQQAISEVRYQWQGMALSASEKRYADGSPALREQWHYRGGFELLAKERRAANDDRSHFYPIVTGPDGVPQEMYSANGRKVWTKHRSLWGWQQTTRRTVSVKAVMRASWASGRMRRAGCGIIYTATTMPERGSI